MSKLLAITDRLGPRKVLMPRRCFAADKAPTTKSACEKEHMKWDASTKTCSKGNMQGITEVSNARGRRLRLRPFICIRGRPAQ